mgnify:CR=1 FL=1
MSGLIRDIIISNCVDEHGVLTIKDLDSIVSTIYEYFDHKEVNKLTSGNEFKPAQQLAHEIAVSSKMEGFESFIRNYNLMETQGISGGNFETVKDDNWRVTVERIK